MEQCVNPSVNRDRYDLNYGKGDYSLKTAKKFAWSLNICDFRDGEGLNGCEGHLFELGWDSE
jgi:hypothetical protein